MAKTEQTDAMLEAVAARCAQRNIKPQCVKCERTLAKIRQDGNGLPVLMMADGPVCADCRMGRPVGVLLPRDDVRTLPAHARGGTPRITLAKSGSLSINRATCDLYEFPPEGYLIFGWDAERGRLLIGLGDEGDEGARAYQRKDDGKGAIACSVKTIIKLHCRLDFEHVQKQTPFAPQYDEETGCIYVEMG